ncbi:MAG: GntR family transcriptional regulator [Sneathiella sp.]
MGLKNNPQGSFTSRMSLYLKVANILRSRILKGAWRKGDRLPNITVLCAEFQVGRITVRQALQLLSEEGLISSHRGRGTFVTSDRISNSLRDKIAANLAGSAQEIRILEISPPTPLPANLLGGHRVFDSYVRIRKLRCHEAVPYCLMDIYVATSLFDLFPKDDISVKTLAKLVSRYSPEPVARAHQNLTVSLADYETSKLLECDMAAPVAEIDRFFANSSDQLLSRGHYLYRGDLFSMETEHVGDPVTDFSTGWLPDVKTD